IFKHVRAPSRWRHLLVIAAGPFVNFAAAAAVWPFLPAGHLFDGPWTVSKLFLAANLLVLVENLLPHSMYTPFGMIGNDGLQLWVCLFRWNKPLPPVRTTSSSAKVRMHQFAKWTSFALLAIATLFFSLFTVFPWIPTPDVLTLQSKLLITAIMLPLALVAGWAAMWTARSTSNMSSAGAPGGEQRMRGIPYTPEQQRSLHEAFQCADRKEFARADAIVDQLMASISSSSPVYAQILLFKLQFILASNDIDRAEKLCLDFINGTASSEHKITVLDGFVASILYDRSSPYLENAERLARLALDMAPETLTLKGSLGGVLAERGKFAEAEPLLVECLNRSPALHDQGISAYYLAVVKAAAGKLKEARSLVKRSIVLHPEPWLVAKAESTLKNWDERGTG
ncbi:MAG TPA: hypothetical protein VN281_18455, partial [Verrucomicrobiae bacterium]|nr:hypothetical protein [Verrucomicrobiae bacterium]